MGTIRNSFVSLLIIGRKKGSSTNVFTETQAKSSLKRKKSNKKKKLIKINEQQVTLPIVELDGNYVVVDYT